MSNQYSYLRSLLTKNDIDRPYLSKLLSLCKASLSNRFTGVTAWNTTEMYQIMDILNEPYENLHLVFPATGKRTS